MTSEEVMLSARVPAELKRRLLVRLAGEGKNLKDWLIGAIARDLGGEPMAATDFAAEYNCVPAIPEERPVRGRLKEDVAPAVAEALKFAQGVSLPSPLSAEDAELKEFVARYGANFRGMHITNYLKLKPAEREECLERIRRVNSGEEGIDE